MNLRYNAGRQLEYRIRRLWERGGYYCVRSAGSKGNWDIVCLNTKTPEVVLIQAKRVRTRTEARRLLKAFLANPPEPEGYIRRMEVYVSEDRDMMAGEVDKSGKVC